ncbi:MAG: MarR family winged helix-turn-helix transcriptional regulator [Gemmatimonadales bacterium]
MPRADAVAQVLAAYPVIHHALRQREVPAGEAVVSAHQATVLGHLDQRDGRTVGDLAQTLGLAMPTVSLLIDRLGRLGMVQRDRDAADKRRVLVRLTAAGAQVARDRSLLDPVRVRSLLEELTPDERAAGVAGLTTLARAIRRWRRTSEEPTG